MKVPLRLYTMSSLLLALGMVFGSIFFINPVSALAPTGTPYSGATPGWIFSTYFKNIIEDSCPVGYSVVAYDTTAGSTYGKKICRESYWKSSDAGVSTFFTGAGNVGIGTDNPIAKLQVNGSIRLGANATFGASTNGISWNLWLPGGYIGSFSSGYYMDVVQNAYWSGGNFKFLENGWFSHIQLGGWDWGDAFIRFFTTPAGVKDTVIPVVERMTISPNGNVGIGTNTPLAKLQIQTNATDSIPLQVIRYDDSNILANGFSAARARGTIGTPLAVQNGDRFLSLIGSVYDGSAWSNSAGIQFYASENQTPSAHGSSITFETTPLGWVSRQSQMLIDPSGNVGIGTNSPTSKLDIAGNIKTNAFTFDGNDDGWLRLRNGDGGAYKDFAVNQLWTHDQITASGWLNSSNGGVNVNYVYVRPQDNGNEGGEIALINSNPESGRNGSIIMDNYNQSLRLFRWRNSPGEYTEYAIFQPDKTVLGMQGNVGIGTSNPLTKLDVRGNSAGNFGTTTSCCTSNFTLGISEATSSNGRLPSIQFHTAGFQEGFLRLASADRTFEIGDNQGAGANFALRNPENTGRNVFLAANGSSYFNAGNVGIGTTSPSYKLQVAGDILANGWLRTTGNSGWYSETYGWGWYMTDSTWIRGYSDKSLWMNNGHIATNGSLSIGYDGATTTARSAIIAGNVGIGTTSPTAKLDVNGNIRFNDMLSTPGRMHITGGEYLYLLNTNGVAVSKAWGGNGNMNIDGDSITQGDMYAYGASNKWIFHTPDDGRTMMYIAPQVGASWAWGNSMRLASNGNVGIGGIDPTVKLDVNGEIKSNAKVTTPELCLNGSCKTNWSSGGGCQDLYWKDDIMRLGWWEMGGTTWKVSILDGSYVNMGSYSDRVSVNRPVFRPHTIEELDNYNVYAYVRPNGGRATSHFTPPVEIQAPTRANGYVTSWSISRNGRSTSDGTWALEVSAICKDKPTYSWRIGFGWGACSTTCGTATQTRSVTCKRDSDGVAVSDIWCFGPKPASSQSCTDMSGCIPCTWQYDSDGNWVCI